MAQLTIRLDDDLAAQIKAHTDGLGRSVNGWAVAVLRTAIDPEFADSDTERTRGRLARAGLLMTPSSALRRPRPEPEKLLAARRAAGRGTSAAAIVVDDRD